MLNISVLIGRLTRDPELKYTQSGTAVCSFTLAVNRRFNKEETDFIDCVAWRQQAEFLANYGSKGRLIAIEGRLQSRTYETQDGQKRKVTEVVADQVKFLDKQGEKTDKPAAQDREYDPGSPGIGDGWDDIGKLNLDDDFPY